MQYARLKPAKGGKANKLSTYVVFGIKFQEANGWYQVEDDVAEYLKTVRQVPEDSDSPKAFDVCVTLDEAQAIDEHERERARRATAENAQAVVRVTSTAETRARRAAAGTFTTSDVLKRDLDDGIDDDLDEDDFPEDDKGLRGSRPKDVIHHGAAAAPGTVGTGAEQQRDIQRQLEDQLVGGDQPAVGNGARLTAANDGAGEKQLESADDATKVEAKPGRDTSAGKDAKAEADKGGKKSK